MAFADRLQRERGKAKIDRLVVLVVERRQRALQASFPSLSLSPSLLSLGRGPVRLSLPSCAGDVSKAQAFDLYLVWTNLSLSLRERRASLSNSSQKSPKLSNSTLKKNSKKHFFQPTRKSMDLDEAMKHFARTSARCCDKARSGRDPWVYGGALE